MWPTHPDRKAIGTLNRFQTEPKKPVAEAEMLNKHENSCLPPPPHQSISQTKFMVGSKKGGGRPSETD